MQREEMMADKNYQERIARGFRERADQVAQQIAAKLSVPSDAASLPLSKQLEMWNQRQTVDPETGQPIDASALFSSGMPIEQVVDKVFPFRSKMVQYQRPNPKDQVAFADKMNQMSEE